MSDPSAYEQTHQLSDGDFLTIADVNHDGKITNADIQPLLDLIATNGGGSLAAVPEPASWLLVVVGMLGMVLSATAQASISYDCHNVTGGHLLRTSPGLASFTCEAATNSSEAWREKTAGAAGEFPSGPTEKLGSTHPI